MSEPSRIDRNSSDYSIVRRTWRSRHSRHSQSPAWRGGERVGESEASISLPSCWSDSALRSSVGDRSHSHPGRQGGYVPGGHSRESGTRLLVIVALTLLAGLALLLIGIKSSPRGWIVRVVLAALATSLLLLGVALTDAALAFRGHGEDMQVAVILLFLCAAADLGASLLVGATMLQRSQG